MGHMQAQEMAALADLDTALVWHLRSNHFPPVPLSMLDTCKRAIELANEGEYDLLMSLPDGVTYRGQMQAPVWAIVEQHHLDAFIDMEEDDDDDDA